MNLGPYLFLFQAEERFEGPRVDTVSGEGERAADRFQEVDAD